MYSSPCSLKKEGNHNNPSSKKEERKNNKILCVFCFLVKVEICTGIFGKKMIHKDQRKK
jgi:hypothetical protein